MALNETSRVLPWLTARAPDALRDPVAELGLAFAYVCNPWWLRDWRLEAQAFTSHEARCFTEAVLALHEQGEPVTLVDAAALVDLSPAVVLSEPVLAVAPDVPGLVMYLRDLYTRRRLHVIAVATAHRASDLADDPAAAAARLRHALDEAAA